MDFQTYKAAATRLRTGKAISGDRQIVDAWLSRPVYTKPVRGWYDLDCAEWAWKGDAKHVER